MDPVGFPKDIEAGKAYGAINEWIHMHDRLREIPFIRKVRVMVQTGHTKQCNI